MAVNHCDDDPRGECLRRFDVLDRKLDLALVALERVGRIEGAARVLGYLVTTAVALAALWAACGSTH